MKRKFTLFFILFCIVMLSETWLPHIRIGGVQPDLLLIYIVFLGILEGPLYGGIAGGVLGLISDMMIGQYIGLGMLGRILAGIVAGYLGEKFYRDNYWITIAATVFAVDITEFIFCFGANLLGWSLSLWGYTLPYILVASLYNGILAPFLYVLFYFCCENGWLKKIDVVDIG